MEASLELVFLSFSTKSLDNRTGLKSVPLKVPLEYCHLLVSSYSLPMPWWSPGILKMLGELDHTQKQWEKTGIPVLLPTILHAFSRTKPWLWMLPLRPWQSKSREQHQTMSWDFVSWCHHFGLLDFPERAWTPWRMFLLASLYFFLGTSFYYRDHKKTLFSEKSEAGLKDSKQPFISLWRKHENCSLQLASTVFWQCQTFDKLQMEESSKVAFFSVGREQLIHTASLHLLNTLRWIKHWDEKMSLCI